MCCHLIFVVTGGTQPSEIHRRLLVQYRKNCVIERTVFQWVERFKSGRTSTTDEYHLSCLTTSQVADNAERVYALI
jgi:hypothetical protein